MHIIFVVTGVPFSRRQPNSVHAKIGVHLVKGWVLLDAIGNSALYAQVGDFLQKHHEKDLDTAMKEMSGCANTRIPIFTCCMCCPNNIVGNN
jgi:hypothetical protein